MNTQNHKSSPNSKNLPRDQRDKKIEEPIDKDEPSEILTQAGGKESLSEKRRRGIGQDYELEGQSNEPQIPSVADKIQTGMSGPNKTPQPTNPGDTPKEGQI